jgi:uncharacterized protein YrrD
MQDLSDSDRSSGNQMPSSMVFSADVNGPAVNSPSGNHLGEIDHLMIDMQSGQIARASMSFGGFVTDVTQQQLTGAPQQSDRWYDDRDYARQSYDCYGVSPYWL